MEELKEGKPHPLMEAVWKDLQNALPSHSYEYKGWENTGYSIALHYNHAPSKTDVCIYMEYTRGYDLDCKFTGDNWEKIIYLSTNTQKIIDFLFDYTREGISILEDDRLQEWYKNWKTKNK